MDKKFESTVTTVTEAKSMENHTADEVQEVEVKCCKNMDLSKSVQCVKCLNIYQRSCMNIVNNNQENQCLTPECSNGTEHWKCPTCETKVMNDVGKTEHKYSTNFHRNCINTNC